MEEKKLVPKLRFPGFTEPWEQRKLGEIVSAYSGGTPSASNKEYYGGDIPFIRSAEINNNHTELYITQKGLKDSSAKLVEKGTILYAMYGATSGEVSISQIDGAINQAILAMVPLMYDGEFIAQYLRRQKKNIINKYLQGGQGNLSANIVLNLQIQLPGVDEANQITSFFVKLDNLITLHQRKLEHLKLKKKSLLQKLFPKEGEVYPELRFPGFTAPWEQRKLGEEAIEILAGGDIEKEKVVYDSGYPIYANALTNDGLVGYYTDYYRVEAPAVTVTGRGEVGHAQARSQNFTPIVRLLAIRSKHDCYFLENAINNYKTIVESTGVPQLTVPQLSAYKLCFPLNIEEEKRISICFQNLDTLITLHQRKLEHLQLLKKALLQQLFV